MLNFPPPMDEFTESRPLAEPGQISLFTILAVMILSGLAMGVLNSLTGPLQNEGMAILLAEFALLMFLLTYRMQGRLRKQRQDKARETENRIHERT